MKKLFKRLGLTIATLGLLFIVAVYLSTYHPADVEETPISCEASAPVLPQKYSLKVLSWNVQYMAGKTYVFYYDILDGSGKDDRPSRVEINKTTAEVARVIDDEKPDLMLLQEVDEGAARTDDEDQVKTLMAKLKTKFPCHASAFYWKSAFVPHPRIMGSVGLKLSTFSRFNIGRSIRHQLPLMPNDPLTKQFYLKRAVHEVRLPVAGGGELAALNTHLDAFAQGTNTMEQQVALLRGLLSRLDGDKIPWVLGGDFNLLPPGRQYADLPAWAKEYYKPESELAPLFETYRAVPSKEEANGPNRQLWFTHYPNDPRAKAQDRTIDYLFASKILGIKAHYVRSKDTPTISDHLPVIAVFAPE